MPSESLANNPFMMMLSPETVIAAMQRSEKLGRLNRRMCHPLDKPMPGEGGESDAAAARATTPPHDD